ncbi:MAG: hypothetical protein NFCOHLIN_02958 [Gammaproteobacteria bacterium]|nr:hypothetical protein [Gammaproteobacteria bacterium]
MNGENLYRLSPVWLQNTLCSAYGLRVNLRRYGRGYSAIEREVFRRETLSVDQIRTLQNKRLKAIVARAATKVPYYRDLFRRLGLDPREIMSVEDLKVLPLLTRAEVQERLAEFVSDDYEQLTTTLWRTSGTTGTGLVFPMTLRAEREQWALWWRYRARFGIDRSTWYAHFYGRSVVPLDQTTPPFWRVNYPGKQILFSGYHMSDRVLGHYVRELNRRRPPWIQGYPSLLSVLAGYMLNAGESLSYRPIAVTTGSETLLPYQRAMIEKAFGAACHEHYGTTEAVANMSECRYGKLHVDEDFGYVEFVKNGEGNAELVATGFANEAFVLLRYRLGDNVDITHAHEQCACGNPGRMVKGIDGRIEDYVVTPDGRKIGRLDHILKDMVNVRECQIVQEDVNRVVFRVVRGKKFTEADHDKLVLEARKRLGSTIRIDVAYVPNLERSKTGKVRFVVSRVSTERRDENSGRC